MKQAKNLNYKLTLAIPLKTLSDCKTKFNSKNNSMTSRTNGSSVTLLLRKLSDSQDGRNSARNIERLILFGTF